MNQVVTFEYQCETHGELWIEAEVSLTPRGPAFSDERGDFGPEMVDIDVDQVAAFNVAGVDIFDQLPTVERVKLREVVADRVEV